MKFVNALDMFRGKNSTVWQCMDSKAIQNYYQNVLIEKDEYKIVERGFKQSIYKFAQLFKGFKDLNATSLKDEKYFKLNEDILSLMNGFIIIIN